MNEAARLVGGRIELSEDEISELNRKIARLIQSLEDGEKPEIEITYFLSDERKDGGAYVTTTAAVRRVDEVLHKVILSDKTKIKIDDVFDIKIKGAQT